MMKIKLIAFFSALILFYNCTGNDENQPGENLSPIVVIKKLTIQEGSDIRYDDFIYEDNKLKGINHSNGNSIAFTYDGNKISEAVKNDSGQSIVYAFNYKNDSLLVSFENSPDYKASGKYQKCVFTYNSKGDLGSINNQSSKGSYYMFIEKDSLNKNIVHSWYGPDDTYLVVDGKNNPYINMNENIKKFLFSYVRDYDEPNIYSPDLLYSLNENNILVYNWKYSSISQPTNTFHHNEIIYNSDNFPIKMLHKNTKNDVNGTLIRQYDIEYQIIYQ